MKTNPRGTRNPIDTSQWINKKRTHFQLPTPPKTNQHCRPDFQRKKAQIATTEMCNAQRFKQWLILIFRLYTLSKMSRCIKLKANECWNAHLKGKCAGREGIAARGSGRSRRSLWRVRWRRPLVACYSGTAPTPAPHSGRSSSASTSPESAAAPPCSSLTYCPPAEGLFPNDSTSKYRK